MVVGHVEPRRFSDGQPALRFLPLAEGLKAIDSGTRCDVHQKDTSSWQFELY